VGLLGHLLHQIPRLPVKGHQRKLPRKSDCGNLLLKVSRKLRVVLCGPHGGDIDVVPAEAENGIPAGWGEGVPLAEEGVGFFGELGFALLVLLPLLDGCCAMLQEELDELDAALVTSEVQWGDIYLAAASLSAPQSSRATSSWPCRNR